MISTNPADEIKKQTECETATEPLRARWDADWALSRLDSEEYKIPTDEGTWETVISNRAAAEGFKIMDYLCYARRKLWIPIPDADKEKRKDLTLTEQLANGCIYLADNEESDNPYQQDSQSALAFYRVQRGWSAKRFILRDEDDKLIPDIAIWDPRNVYWKMGKKRFIWVCYVNYRTEDEIKDEYHGWNGKFDERNSIGKMMPVYDIWAINLDKDERNGTKVGDAEEAVAISREYVKEPEKTGLDYLPIRIKPGRAIPLIHDDKSDNIKYVGEGFLASNRQVVVNTSKMLSILMTSAKQQAKSPIVIEYDSTQGPAPSFGDKDPFVAGRTIFLDVAKKQKVAERLQPPTLDQILTVFNILSGEASIGGLSPVAWGQINQALPAQGIDILTHSTMDAIKPFKQGMELDYVWWASEIVRQFKNGDFKEYEIEGRDSSDNPFKVKVKPDKIDKNWKFQCELVPDLLRDKAANLAWVLSAIKGGMLSMESGRDMAQLVTDTDLESQKIAKEQADAVFNIGQVEAVIAKIKDYGKKPTMEDYFLLKYMMNQLGKAISPPQPPTNPGGNGSMPVKETNNVMAIPEQIRQAAMASMGANQPPGQGMM